jgi:RNA polymerase sigma-70 factor, ECF subfamily
MVDALRRTNDVEAAKLGDQDAWERLYRHVYPRLHAYLLRRVGSDHVEDALSDTMTRAISSIERLHPGPAGFDGWVFGIARRVVAEHYRQVGRRHRQLLASQAMAVGDAQSPEEGPAGEADRIRVRHHFSRLSPAEQELLELRVVSGLSAEEVGTVLEKHPGAVRTAQSRALAHLRRLIEADGD